MTALRLLRQQAYVAGEWRDADDRRTQSIHDPADGALVGTVPVMGTVETRRAIESAQRALQSWKARPAKERAVLLKDWHSLILEHQDELAQLMTFEQGKPLAEAHGEVHYAASYVEWFAEEARRVYGDIIPSPHTDRRLLVLKQPIGVTAAITPWNFPLAMVTRKVAPALASGCTMVLKPAPQTPFCALALAALAERAGIPPGVLNVVTGSATEIGAEMTGNPMVRKLSFTGSTSVGRLLMAQCAHDIKKLSLELGGNAPFIVFEDADLDAAVAGAVFAKYRNNGQTCVCANRFYIHDSIYNAFAQKLNEAVSRLRVGNGFEDGVTIGPLIDSTAVTKIQSHIDDAVAKGAKILAGGKAHSLGGSFFEPTILTEVPHDAIVAQDETFGPLAPLLRFTNEAEVIGHANNTESGLAAYFYTRDLSRIFRIAEALEYGMVGINSGAISTEVAPFGGMKSSGLGREGSRFGIEEYVEIKYLNMAV